MQMTAGAPVECLVVQRRAEQLGVLDAAGVGPHVDGCDWTTSGVEPEKSMPKCRDADRTSFLGGPIRVDGVEARDDPFEQSRRDRKSTRLNSSHSAISYAVFCL